jgi:hypothetical protein
VGLKRVVEEFLGLVFSYDYSSSKKKIGVQREREIEAEIRGFNKAQEALRDLVRIHGTDAIHHLADERADGQVEPQMVGNTRLWIG